MVAIEVRREEPKDHRAVEELTREAFWDLHLPGCDEHYLVHVMRDHEDFIPDLDLVAVSDGRIVGNIMYTRSRLVDEEQHQYPAVTFGPVSVHPEYQRMGIGSALIRETLARLEGSPYSAVVIWGNPKNYVGSGFRNCKDYQVSVMPDKFPTCLLVKEMRTGILGNRFLTFMESGVYTFDSRAAKEFDRSFPQKERGVRPSQEEFRILSRSFVE